MKKRFFVTLSLVLVMACSAVFGAGCEMLQGEQAEPKSIVSIEKTSTDGIIDTYTITYSDGSTSTFQITNGLDGEDGEKGEDGKDGKDGKDFDVYQAYLDFVEAENSNITFSEFLKEYVEFDGNLKTEEMVAADLMRSVAKVNTCFIEGVNGFEKHYNLYSGSSVIYKIDQDYTYFVTNYHVVYGEEAVKGHEISDDIHVYLYGSESRPTTNYNASLGYATTVTYDAYAIPCTYVGGSAVADIAVIKAETSKVKAINPDVKAVTLAKGYEVGQTAIAIGNPNADGISYTKGVVSVVDEDVLLSVDGTSRAYRSIRIDTSLYPGNSGGGLFNVNGELIGITNAGNLDDEHINFAIPLEITKNVVEGILHYSQSGLKNTKKLYLGINLDEVDCKYVYNQETELGELTSKVVISNVEANSVAYKLGLVANDVITAININGVSYKVNMRYDVSDILYNVRVGDKVYLELSNKTVDAASAYTVMESDLIAVE